MAYELITESDIAIGRAVRHEFVRKVRNSIIDHESRISALSLGAAPVEVFNIEVVNATSASTLTGLLSHEAITTFRVVQVKVQIFEKGIINSGILEIDVKKNTTLDDIGMTSILTTKPLINFSIASDYDSTLGAIDPLLQTINAGEFLRLDITSLPPIPFGKFRVVVYGVI